MACPSDGSGDLVTVGVKTQDCAPEGDLHLSALVNVVLVDPDLNLAQQLALAFPANFLAALDFGAYSWRQVVLCKVIMSSRPALRAGIGQAH